MFWRRSRHEPAPEEEAAGPGATGQAVEEPGDEAGASGPDAGASGPDHGGPEGAASPRPGALWGPGVGPAPVLDAAGATAAAQGGATAPGASPESSGEPGATIADGLQASRRGFMARLHGIFRAGPVDEATWEEVEETLIAGDVGARLAMDVVGRARATARPGRSGGRRPCRARPPASRGRPGPLAPRPP